jgi:hypothetical protein
MTPAFTVLRCRQETVPNDHWFANEIARYSPVLVLFPEDSNVGPPWRGKWADYHPRPVEIYLDNANVRSPKIWHVKRNPRFLGAPLPISALAMPVNALADWSSRILRQRSPINLMKMLSGDLDAGLIRTTLDSGVRPSRSAWARYFEILRNNPGKYPPTCYVRVVAGTQDRVAIQYWFFYYFNDYWNRHQADFEEITVFLRRKGPDLCPTACYFGAHKDGAYRFWQPGGVWPVDDTHPVAFVARGSHAFYATPPFEKPRIPSFTLLERRFLALNLKVGLAQVYRGRTITDDVVPANFHAIESTYKDEPTFYDALVMPQYLHEIRPGNPRVWEKWWWLRFTGDWGPGNWLPTPLPAEPAVRGPATQDRWADPWGFLARCEADVDWKEL